jgi:sterol-4alpha-carboxylate 3-dehydrogenase (decarboxylating)
MLGEYDTQLSYRPLLISGFKARFQLGENNNLFDATYVGNIAYAHLLAAKALLLTGNMSTAPLDTERIDGEAFIITNGTPVYFWDLMRRIWQFRGWEEDKNYDLKRVWVMSAFWANLIAGVLELIMGIFGKVPNFTKFAVKQSTIDRYFCIDKARLRLKYEPIWSLEEGIERGVKYNLARIEKENEAKKSK